MFGLRTAEIAQGIGVKFVAFTAALIMVASFALGYVLFVWLHRRLRLSLAGRRWWLIPVAWMVAEYARAVLFSIVSFGPGGRIGAYWSFGNVGYWLVDTPLVFISRWGGLYALSLTAAFLVVASLRSWRQKDWRPIAVVLATAVVVSTAGWALFAQPNGQKRDIVAVQFGNEFSPEAFSANTTTLLSSIPAQSADAVILPEYSHLWELQPEADTAALTRILKRDDGLVIDSVQEKSQGLGHNLISYHKSNGDTLFHQQKYFSVPGGEYVPYVYQVILAYVGQEQLLLHFNEQKSINHGDTPELPFAFEGVKYGALACSGIIAPELYRGMTARGAEILTSSASIDTMGISPSYSDQVIKMAKLHAVANARPFVQASRGGYSYIIDQNGGFVDKKLERGYGVLRGEVTSNSSRTTYSYTSDWVVIVGIFVIISMAARYWKIDNTQKET